MAWHKRFFIFLLLFLPTQLGFHLWPQWSILLGRKIDYLSPTIYITDIIIFSVLLFWFIESRPRITPKTVGFIFLFSLVNIWTAPSEPLAIYKWSKVLEFGLLGFYIVRTKPDLSFIVKYLSWGIIYASLIAIGQFIFQHSLGGVFWFFGERTFDIDTSGISRAILNGREYLRAYSLFPHPNVLGGFLVVTLPMLFQMKSDRRYIFLTISLGLIALVLTFSRSAWVVGAIAIFLTVGKTTNRKIFGAVLLFALLAFLAFRIDLQEESVVVRQQLNSAALSLWLESPLVGIGLGNFLVKLPQVLPSRTIYFLQPVHNIYLLVLSEVGLVGFGFFIFILWKALKSSSVTPLRVALGSVLLLGLVDHYFLSLQQGQLLFTIIVALQFSQAGSLHKKKLSEL